MHLEAIGEQAGGRPAAAGLKLQQLACWLPLLASLAWLAWTIGLRPLSVPDEGRYVGVAWHMLTSGDWLVPRLDGLPYFHKPPLFYWITAGAMGLFGHEQAAVRLAPLLGAAAGTTALYLFTRRWWSLRVANLGLLAIATQPLVFVGAQYANLDMLVAGCVAATIVAFAHAALVCAEGNPPPRAVLAAGYVFAALGLLAKGLIGLALPGITLVAWMLWLRRPGLLRLLFWGPGWLLFLALSAPWFVLMQRAFPGFANYFFYVQQFARYTQADFNNPQPWYFYPVVLGVLALPWTAWLACALLRRPAQARAGLRALPWLWLALVTLFFSLPHSKLVGYILPAAWPIGLLVADAADAALDGSAKLRRLWTASGVAAVLACLLGVAWGTLHPLHSQKPLAETLGSGLAPGERVLMLDFYYFDLPFYARLAEPALVVERWNDADTMKGDNWRRELADAGSFDQQAARRILLLPADVAGVLCGAQGTWVIGPRADAAPYAPLSQVRIAGTNGDAVLWHLPALATGVTRAGCPGAPHA